MPAPEYPELAKLARIEGTVHVRVLVGRDGRVRDTILVKGAHAILDQEALAAAKRAIFTPAIQQQKPVPVWVTIPFRFSLH
jgi:protein TonB